MKDYFVCKVNYERINEKGIFKTVSESYLVEAASHAEAENCIIDKMKLYTECAVMVKSVIKQKIADLFGHETEHDFWYRVKINFISLNESTGAEKRVPQTFLVKADNVRGAISGVENGLHDTVSDYEITAVIESPILEVFLFDQNFDSGAFYDNDKEESTEE
ncbi:MAG: DUF4494 domain-containing protein [Prevotellaceae bacterium]|jgi:hypothetical protein|nr:DUF4494 domain-containing protein [Prevotellaceae bacterium]